VVQHLFMNETAQLAHVVLPTTAFGEEEVSFTSTDRRIQLVERVIDPPAGLTPAWEQIVRVAQSLGANWNYGSAAEVMDEIGEAVPFYSGANYKNLAREYGRQWPCTKDRPLGTQFLFANSNGNRPFRFAVVPKTPPAASTKDYPFTLVFGNSLYYWNQNVLVRHSETLKREYRMLMIDYPEGFVEVNDDDARQFAVRDGDHVQLRTADAVSIATARVTREVRRGTIFVPHFMREVETELLGAHGDGRKLVPVRLEKEKA